jgi:hypothetical protein
MSESVTVTRSVLDVVDDYGNPTYETSTFTVQCLVGFGSTDEAVSAETNSVSSQVTLYMPTGTVIIDGDIFGIRGDSYVKDGIAQAWASASGIPKGVVVAVRSHDG